VQIFCAEFFESQQNPFKERSMAKKTSSKSIQPESVLPTDDFSKLSEDQAAEILEVTFETICDRLEASGVDPDLITGILFNHFTQRLCDVDDREQYEMILELALETPWDEHTYH
jgi:hypothetical protein